MTLRDQILMDNANKNEDIALQKALLQSSREVSHSVSVARSQPASFYEDGDLITLHQSNSLVLLSAPDADTLAVIGVPPQQSSQTDKAFADVVHRFSGFHRIHSHKIFTLGSAKLSDLLGPTSQFRTERRLRNQGVLQGAKPAGIKYILDLRPPKEDEDAILLVTELSCSRGVLTWFKAQQKYRIPPTMVCGQDDSLLLPTYQQNARLREQWSKSLETKLKPAAEALSGSSSIDNQVELSSDPKEKSSPAQKLPPARVGNWKGVMPTLPPDTYEAEEEEEEEDQGARAPLSKEKANDPESPRGAPGAATDDNLIQAPEIQPEYSQIRHWSAIERLLHAIEGNDPLLDSAPKLWTFFAVANYFDCASNERVSGWIARWLFAAPNHNFIQCNPEISYRIGFGIQSEILLKDAFSQLVGEQALLNVYCEIHKIQRFERQRSVAGRKLEVLDEDELNRVDHAANTFTQRVQSQFEALIGEEMQWLEQSKVFGKLENFVARSSREDEIAKELTDRIKNFVRSRVIGVLVRNYGPFLPGLEHAPESVRPFQPHATSQNVLYNILSGEERIFTRFFWMALRQDRLDRGCASINIISWWELAPDSRDLWKSAMEFAKILKRRASGYADEPHEYGTNNGALRRKHHSSDSEEDNSNFQSAELDVLQGIEDEQLMDVYMLPFGNDDRSGIHETSGAEPSSFLGDGDQLPGISADLPIRVATSQTETSPKPAAADRIIEAAEEEAPEAPGAWVDIASNLYGTDKMKYGYAAMKDLCDKKRQSKKKESSELWLDGDDPDFPLDVMFSEITLAMHGICDEMLYAAHLFRDKEAPPIDLIDTLMCLNDDEWRYLPLWAGGCDDGSGGVFAGPDVPSDESGRFPGGKRGLSLNPSDSVDGGSTSCSSWSHVTSTIGKASRQATDGTATETATVQSLCNSDLDIRSLDGADEEMSTRDDTKPESKPQDSHPAGFTNGRKPYQFEFDVDIENDDDDDEAVAAFQTWDSDDDDDPDPDAEEAGWDDCLV